MEYGWRVDTIAYVGRTKEEAKERVRKLLETFTVEKAKEALRGLRDGLVCRAKFQSEELHKTLTDANGITDAIDSLFK